jgi:uncharacterized protein (DUF1501 family)
MNRWMTRNNFLMNSASALKGWTFTPVEIGRWLPRLAFFNPAQGSAHGNVLVCIFLRGGMDGLNVVIPQADPDYYFLRPKLAIAEMKTGDPKTALDLDGFFGLHPSLAALKDLWDDKGLALVHAVGSPDPTHSHFDAMDYMERGTPGVKQLSTGWLARHLQVAAAQSGSPFRAVGFGGLLQASLRGPVPAIALQSIASFHLGGAQPTPEIDQFQTLLKGMYAVDAELAAPVNLTLTAADDLQKVAASPYQPAHGIQYPASEFGKTLEQVAQLIKADVGLEIAAVDIGGWDTHVNEGTVDGQMPRLLSDLGSSLAAFYKDLGDAMKGVTVVAMSEFGRRVMENGGGGTDHGHGNIMFVIGKSILGGKVYGQWPGLASEKLVAPGDLAVTTDFRTVLAELVEKHLQDTQIDQVFPGFNHPAYLGLAQSL